MARIFIDGFEHGDLKFWTGIDKVTIETGVILDGVYCAKFPYASEMFKMLPAKSEYYVAFRVAVESRHTVACALCNFFNGSTTLGFLRFDLAGTLTAVRSTSTVLLTSAMALGLGVEYLIEVRYLPHASAGVFQVKVNGVLVIDYSGNTGTTTPINNISFGKASYWVFYLDNVVIDDAAWPGNSKIQAIKPTGAGNSTQWTPSAGANYACVDEVPPSEADYIESNVIGHLDLYAASDLVGTIGAVKCVQVQALAVAEGAPTPTNLQFAVRSGGTDYFSGDKLVPSGAAQLAGLWETDPATGVAWLAGAVNAMEIGVKAVA